ncbi:hypothetical protein MUP35_03260 [Patescibacteria group bacterium]|nr:hypothetical protein [Patescibacteria group bacterium]
MKNKVFLMRDWNKEIDKLEKRLDETESSTSVLTTHLINEINTAINEGLLASLFGKNPEVNGDFTDNYVTLFQWNIIPKRKKKTFLLYLKPYGRSNLPRYLYLQGTDQETGKSKLESTRDISENGIKKLAKKLKKELST